MTTEETGEWQTCVCDDDYEINDAYPYPIRRKGSDKIIKETVNNEGYIYCNLNCIQYKKHRIIGLQFIPNEDPEHKTIIDHVDHNRANNHIDNLRWCSSSENNKNRASHRGRQFVFLDELPDTAESLDSYNGHDLDGVFIDYEQKKVYLFNGIKWRELTPTRNRGNLYYHVPDIEDKYIRLSHLILFGN